jgi:hypothetical protein
MSLYNINIQHANEGLGPHGRNYENHDVLGFDVKICKWLSRGLDK